MMHAYEFRVWHLTEHDENSLGLSCSDKGLAIAGTPFLDRKAGQFVPRSQRELEALLSVGYGFPVSLDSRMHRIYCIAKALNEGDLCRATISAVLLQIPELTDRSARHRVEARDLLLKRMRGSVSRDGANVIEKQLSAAFDPLKHPRWPKGVREGGEFRPAGGSAANENSAVRLVSDEIDRHRIGGNEGPPMDEPPEIPVESPASNKVRNALIRSVARWLNRVLTAAEKADPEKRTKAILALLAGIAWLVASLPDIESFQDAPKDLNDLQSRARRPTEEGYQDHHIVEGQYDSKNPQANSRRFSDDQLEGRDNIVRIPSLKHWEISRWYSTPNEKYEGMAPRDYLRGKSWDEQYKVGLEKLKDYGVLK